MVAYAVPALGFPTGSLAGRLPQVWSLEFAEGRRCKELPEIPPVATHGDGLRDRCSGRLVGRR